ncbi:GNAT family N-acetyltransferase [Streptomyces sp. CT34]|uniref:GNAT family N-acetyltransferase n=1 Tax=Streptomyces sp. CT34 TaxID=1553907 RepID=UPI00069259E7|nr:GNAT family N-acetyltransferase [Streptomyces sp. CT34]
MTHETAEPDVRIEPWTVADLSLLHEANTPAMTRHLGGPETDEQIAMRHRRYLDGEGAGQMFRVVLLPEGAAVGTTGFWETTWRGEQVYEAGWSVLPSYQGRGIATAAACAVIAAARAEGRRRTLHAFPSVANAASNAVCRKAGFALVGECEVEYPKGHLIRAHEWRVEPAAAPSGVGPLSAADRRWRAP